MTTPTNPQDTSVLQHREFQFRATSEGEGREITGLGVPYDSEIELFDGFFEKFAPGSVNDEGAILRYGHRDPIGSITNTQDTTEGREITAKISDTAQGRDIATLVRDGVLSKLSIGFYPVAWSDEEREDGLHRTYTEVNAVEFSIVEFPAYPTAGISQIRNTPTLKGNPMPTTDNAELRSALDSLTNQMTEFERETRSRLADLATPTEESPAFAFRSIGEYAKALAMSGDERNTQARAVFSGAVTSDVTARPAWLGVIEKRMAAKQIVTNMFTHTMDLPSTGMTVEYAVKKEKSGVKVAKQAKQGDKIATGTPSDYVIKSAPVDTYAGLGKLSLQAIERASISLLDDLLYDQAFEYANQIEAATRTLFTSTVTTAEESPLHTFPSLAGATVNDWIDFALSLVDAYDETPYVFDGLAVSAEVFRALAHLDRDPKALQFSGAPTDHQGTLSVRTGSGSFAEINVQRIPNWTGKHAVGYAREAIRIKEAPGAPLRLQDTDILDLSKDFAVYGYAAHFAPKPELIMAAKFTA